MLDRVFQGAVSRRIAQRLEAGDNRLLGSETTTRLARGFNRVTNRRLHALRRGLYDHQLEQLIEENGEATRTPPQMADGYYLDTSHSLPQLDRLLEESQQIIAERGGVRRGGGDRAFFQQILNDDCVARFPSILDFATSTDVLRPVIDYLGFLPTLSVSKPLGVRLNESDTRFAPDPPDGTYRQSQLFHRDYHDVPMVYVIVALRDVTPQSGPFSFLPADASRRATNALRYGRRGSPYRVTDDRMYAVVPREELVEMVCPAGTVLFLDSSTCFHYGSRDAVNPRYLMMYAYVSVCRTDFGDILRAESPVPVSDRDSRTRRMKYPVHESDSRLRRLVVDREYTE